MEERIIDDEYGRGIRLKKTKDGYVDVTDELAEQGEETLDANELSTVETDGEGDEVSFEFPDFNEEYEDEDMIGLPPEEVEKRRKEREAEEAKRKAEYQQVCAEGQEMLALGGYKSALMKFEKALKMDENPTEASVGYWRAKTADFTDPDALVSEYVESGVDNMEYDLGYEAVEIIKREYKPVFEERLEKLTEEEAPLKAEVEEKQEKRRKYLKGRLKNSLISFAVAAVPFITLVILTVVYIMKNFTTPDNRYIMPTIIMAAGALVTFIVFAVLTNKLINAGRIYRANERLDSTEEGSRLMEIGLYKELYAYLVASSVEETMEEATEESVKNDDVWAE